MGKLLDLIGLNKYFHKYKRIKIDDGTSIISPVEAKVAHIGRIDEKGTIISKNNKKINLNSLIGHFAAKFFGGTYITFYLAPLNKHFWVMPCDGKFVYTQKNEGKSWIPICVRLEDLLGIELLDKAVKINASIGSILQTKSFPIAMIAIGSLNVNKICMDYEEQKNYKKGVPCGYFSLGSSMILCFPHHQKFLVKEGDKVDIGESIAKWRLKIDF